MEQFKYHLRRNVLSHIIEKMLLFSAWRMSLHTNNTKQSQAEPDSHPANPSCPEDFKPLENACFQNPYAFYKMIRDNSPVYQLPNGIYCISRYEDITAVCRDTDNYSSTHQGVIPGLKPGQSIIKAAAKMEKMGGLGLIPTDVLAVSDPPLHTSERKVGHQGLNSRFVKSLDAQVETMVKEMMDGFVDKGQVEFMQEFGWKLPMKLIMTLLGFPEQDYERIKTWCVKILNNSSGIATQAELKTGHAALFAFFRYCWQQFRISQKTSQQNLCTLFANAAADSNNPMTEQTAVSAIFQLIIAGSDSSATSMGNALKMLIENPWLEAELRADMDKLPAFIEEVFRLEAAFQGHFRWTKADVELQGVKLPKGSRIFLMWGSGNRDERFFENPNEIILDRPNGKKHLTFGHGIHACIGRELARMEIRIVIREFLLRTRNLRIEGEAPFIASMFARTLLQLSVSFEAISKNQKPFHSTGQT